VELLDVKVSWQEYKRQMYWHEIHLEYNMHGFDRRSQEEQKAKHKEYWKEARKRKKNRFYKHWQKFQDKMKEPVPIKTKQSELFHISNFLK